MAESEETVTVGGMTLPVAKGWTRSVKDQTTVLTRADVPNGSACALTLLGGEVFTGSLRDRLDAEWKDFESIGKVQDDDRGKITGAGNPVVVAGRSGRIELKTGPTVQVWLIIVAANGRIERMVFVASSAELYTRHGAAVAGMLNAAKFAAPKPVATTAPAATALPAPPATGQFGRMIYRVPEGWRERRADGTVILSPISPPRGESLEILLLPAIAAPGPAAAELERSWAEVARRSGLIAKRAVNNQEFNAHDPQVSFKGWEYVRADGTLYSPTGDSDYSVNLTILKVNGRAERMAVRARGAVKNLQRYSLREDPGYHAAIQTFLFSLRFDDWKDLPAETGSLQGAGIVGVWFGSSVFGTRLHTGYLICLSNGRAYFADRFPLRGLADFNAWIDAEESPQRWGTYRFKDGQGMLTMPYGEIPLRAKDAELIVTTNKWDYRFIRLPSADGTRLQGTYVFDAVGGPPPLIRFTADGQFFDDRALIQLHVETSYPYSPTFEPGAGTYRVKDYTMRFDYKDGRTYRIAYPGVRTDDRKSMSPESLPIGYGDQALTLKK